MMWDTENGGSASVPEHRQRVEREREIACYLLLVSSLAIKPSCLHLLYSIPCSNVSCVYSGSDRRAKVDIHDCLMSLLM